jgi:hypothetical protein
MKILINNDNRNHQPQSMPGSSSSLAKKKRKKRKAQRMAVSKICGVSENNGQQPACNG